MIKNKAHAGTSSVYILTYKKIISEKIRDVNINPNFFWEKKGESTKIMTRTKILRARLLLINKLIGDVIDELRNYGIDTDYSEFSKAYNKRINGKKAEKIREITEKIVADWEDQK